jgi:hypothetical protein
MLGNITALDPGVLPLEQDANHPRTGHGQQGEAGRGAEANPVAG